MGIFKINPHTGRLDRVDDPSQDSDDNGIIDRAEALDDGAGNTASAANTKDAVDKKHTQNTDTKLDEGGANEIDASEIIKAQTGSYINYYVNPDTGSDSNDGLTSGSPFLTVQHAIDLLPKALKTYANIRLSDSLNYTESGIILTGFIAVGDNGYQRITIHSSSSNPANVLFTSSNNIITVDGCSIPIRINNISFKVTSDSRKCINVNSTGNVRVYGCRFADNGNSNTNGIYGTDNSHVSVELCRNYDTNKVTYGMYMTNGSIAAYNESYTFGDTTYFDASEGTAIDYKTIIRASRENITKTYYVNPDTGSDINNGTTTGTPFATVQHAIDLIPKVVRGSYAIRLLDSLNYTESSINLYGISSLGDYVNQKITITSNSSNPANVLFTSGSNILKIYNCSVRIQIALISFKVANSSRRCIEVNSTRSAYIYNCKFADNNNYGTSGVYASENSLVHVRDCSDYDANKIYYGLFSQFGSLVFTDGDDFGDIPRKTETSSGKGSAIMEDGLYAPDKLDPSGANEVTAIDAKDAVTKKHTQDTDVALRTDKLQVDASGNTSIVGELKIKIYSQDNEPTLTGDNFLAIWKDTNDSNKIYLIFRRGSGSGIGDQVKTELI